MRKRLLLRPVVLVGVLGLAAAEPATAQTATGAVQVTKDPAPLRAHSSPQVAVNPKTGELVVVESDVRGNRACAVHLSTDGGRSWFPGGDSMVKPFND